MTFFQESMTVGWAAKYFQHCFLEVLAKSKKENSLENFKNIFTKTNKTFYPGMLRHVETTYQIYKM